MITRVLTHAPLGTLLLTVCPSTRSLLFARRRCQLFPCVFRSLGEFSGIMKLTLLTSLIQPLPLVLIRCGFASTHEFITYEQMLTADSGDRFRCCCAALLPRILQACAKGHSVVCSTSTTCVYCFKLCAGHAGSIVC